ncbi:MAG TPA: amidohydrolase family protein, partial [Gemmataceae bacterium]
MADQFTLTARWVFPVSAPPLERGLVTVAGDRIAAVEPHGTRTADLDLGDAAIVPGFVNAHTHLDLTGARGRTPPTPDFVGWLRQVIAHRRALDRENQVEDVHTGLVETTFAGSTLIGDISGTGWSWQAAMMHADCRTVVFQEVLGLTAERARSAWENAVDWHNWTEELCKDESNDLHTYLRPGISPHAPYSVHQMLLRRVVDRAKHRQFPIAIHLAEWAAEADLLRDQTGALVPFLHELGVWDPSGLVRSWEQVVNLASGPFPALFIHCNYLPAEIQISTNVSVVYCPRTHAAFGHPPHPFRQFLARGVRVALGTDSLASNPDLSILAEARFVRSRHRDLSGDTLLRLATLSGAEALGWADETGSLEPGKSADFAVV